MFPRLHPPCITLVDDTIETALARCQRHGYTFLGRENVTRQLRPLAALQRSPQDDHTESNRHHISHQSRTVFLVTTLKHRLLLPFSVSVKSALRVSFHTPKADFGFTPKAPSVCYITLRSFCFLMLNGYFACAHIRPPPIGTTRALANAPGLPQFFTCTSFIIGCDNCPGCFCCTQTFQLRTFLHVLATCPSSPTSRHRFASRTPDSSWRQHPTPT